MRAMKERDSTPQLPRRFHLVLLHLAEQARRDLDSLAARAMHSIHSLRTRMKNLRALLCLVKSRIAKPTRKAINALAGELKDAFAEQRNAHVLAALRAKFPTLHASAIAEKGASHHAQRDRKAKADASRLIRMLSKLGLSGLAWDDVIAAYLRCYLAGRKAMNQCERKPGAKSFHKLRCLVKDLFYQSQALQPLDGMKTRRTRAERLADRLGKMQDFHVLRDSVKKSRAPNVLKQIAKRQRKLEPAIFKAAEKLFDKCPHKIERALKRCVKFHPAIAAQAVRQT